jgi:hypothetical protein
MAADSRMTRISPEVWNHLADETLNEDVLRVRRAMPETSERLLAGLDREGRRHLLIALDDSESQYNDRKSRGIEIVTRRLSILGGPESRYVDLSCLDPLGFDVFDSLGGELARAVAAGIEEPAVAARRLVGKWRRFWLTQPAVLLTRDEQIGLFAELWFIAYWMVPKVGAVAAIEAWRGPFGARHDIELLNCSIEVKATTSVSGRSHSIHGLEQLLPPENGGLLLFSLMLREEGGASNTLPGLVQRVRDIASQDDDSIIQFETRLQQSKYQDAASVDYEALRLRVVSERLYAVIETFPRILPSSFSAGVPDGVGEISYVINLSGFDELVVAKSPEQFVLPGE